MVVVESTARGFFGLSILTRFGHRYQVLSPAHEREQVRDDAQRLARYFDVAVKEGTADVIPSARSGKSPMLKWKKRPKTTFRYAFLFLVCLIPLAMHAWEALRGSG